MDIEKSVGRGGVNKKGDVALIQLLINLAARSDTGQLTVDGGAGPRTVEAIEAFQRGVLNMQSPDGRVDPYGATWRALLNASPAIAERIRLPIAVGARMAESDYQRAATSLACEVAAIKAVAAVESAGDGFFTSGRPKILFEAHVFSKRTHHKYDKAFPDISSAKWNRSLYKGGEKEYDRLLKAMIVDRAAGLSSASWGRFQIMGFNHAAAGVPTLEAFITAMFTSEGAQLDAVVAFLKSTHLDNALKNKDWKKFAAGYNGPGYAEHQYDVKLKAAYERASAVAKK